MAEPPLLALAGIRYHLGDQTILDGVELGIAPGERLSLVGRNGAGKSTLLQIPGGRADRRFAARASPSPAPPVATLPQEPDFTGHAERRPLCRGRPGRFAGALGLPRRRLPGRGEARRRQKSSRAVRRRGAPRRPGPRPGVRARRAAAGRADQPSGPADHRMAGGRAFRSRRSAADQPRPRFLAKLSRRTLWLDRGRLRETERGFAEFETWQQEVFVSEEIEPAHKLDRKIAAETQWMREGISARRTRNMGRVRACSRPQPAAATNGFAVALTSSSRCPRRAVGWLAIEAGATSPKASATARGRERLLHQDPARRPRRPDRPQRRRQDDAAEDPDRSVAARQRHRPAGRQPPSPVLSTSAAPRSIRKRRSTRRSARSAATPYLRRAGRHVASYMRDFLFDPRLKDTPAKRAVRR